jgi:hypothetical protein
MPEEQQSAWKALFEIHDALPHGWVLAGGQAVYLHCIERAGAANRATTDADTILDVRAKRGILRQFTSVLQGLGFEPHGATMEGHQYKWVRGHAEIDVLIPRWLKESVTMLRGVTGGTAIAAPGAQQAIFRSETVEVSAGTSVGNVNRTTILGSLVGKAAALEIHDDPKRERHLTDFVSLAAISRASDFRGAELKKLDRRRLANMLGQLAVRPATAEAIPDGEVGLERVRRLLQRASSVAPRERARD